MSSTFIKQFWMQAWWPGLTSCFVRSLFLPVSFFVYCDALSIVSWLRIFSIISSSSSTFSKYSLSICFLSAFNSFKRRVLSYMNENIYNVNGRSRKSLRKCTSFVIHECINLLLTIQVWIFFLVKLTLSVTFKLMMTFTFILYLIITKMGK